MLVETSRNPRPLMARALRGVCIVMISSALCGCAGTPAPQTEGEPRRPVESAALATPTPPPLASEPSIPPSPPTAFSSSPSPSRANPQRPARPHRKVGGSSASGRRSAKTPLEARWRLYDCQKRLAEIGTAAEMYSTDHDGTYPEALDQLMPDYLKASVPSRRGTPCEYSFESHKNPDGSLPAFDVLIACQGNHSAANVPAGYPRFTSQAGVAPRTLDLATLRDEELRAMDPAKRAELEKAAREWGVDTGR